MQVKYYGSAEDTAKAISRPDYGDLDKVVPSDQLDEVRQLPPDCHRGRGRPPRDG